MDVKTPAAVEEVILVDIVALVVVIVAAAVPEAIVDVVAEAAAERRAHGHTRGKIGEIMRRRVAQVAVLI